MQKGRRRCRGRARNAPEIHHGADAAFDDSAFGQLSKSLFALAALFFLNDDASIDNNIFLVRIELRNAALNFLALRA